MMNRGTKTQIGFTIGLLILTEMLYRLWAVPGVAINCVPTTAPTMWGVLCGKLLMGERSDKDKITRMTAFGLGMVILGYSMDSITPIIK